MEIISLQALLEADKEMILANLARDRSLSAAQTVLEKAVDRVMYRYVERCADPRLRDEAQYLLQSVKNTLPMIDVVGEAREWQKTVNASDSKKKTRPAAIALLIAGAVLVLASVLAVLIGGGFGGILSFIKALAPTALGIAIIFWAGILTAKPKKKRLAEPRMDVKTEFLVDADKAWHCLRGAMLMADHQLETIRQEADVQRQRSAAEAGQGSVSQKELELFAELLESAYAAQDDNARETVSAIRFFLHNAGVEAVDFEAGRENWFEFLPAGRPGTLRPALTAEGRLLKKGLASA